MHFAFWMKTLQINSFRGMVVITYVEL